MVTEAATPILSDRDREVLVALTHKVRFFSQAQVARTWWANTGARTMRRRLQQLELAGLLQRRTVQAHPELLLEEPLFRWAPGYREPEIGALAYQLQVRWREPLAPTPIVIATSKAAKLFGGGGGELKRPTQVTHDLHVATVYLRFLEKAPGAAVRWRGEDVLSLGRHARKVPDAVILPESGEAELIIEFAGAYKAPRLRKLHEYASENGIPYEVW